MATNPDLSGKDVLRMLHRIFKPLEINFAGAAPTEADIKAQMLDRIHNFHDFGVNYRVISGAIDDLQLNAFNQPDEPLAQARTINLPYARKSILENHHAAGWFLAEYVAYAHPDSAAAWESLTRPEQYRQADTYAAYIHNISLVDRELVGPLAIIRAASNIATQLHQHQAQSPGDLHPRFRALDRLFSAVTSA